MSFLNGAGPQHVKFISYTGKRPNLCGGVLTLEIDGTEHRFGHESGQHNGFWVSGERCGFASDYSDSSDSYVTHGPWEIDESDIPEELKRCAEEIGEVFECNVEQGCCGGCI